MSAQQRATAAAALIAGAVTLAGCGSSPGSAVSTSAASSSMPVRASSSVLAQYGTPVQATLSWFSAINRKDKPAAVAHFEPAAAGLMNWGNGDTSTWPTFSRLNCRQVARSAATASVYCTFSESQAPAEGNPDSFWTVALALQSDKQWLITSYGQG